MSLLSYASPWTSNDDRSGNDNSNQKKRTPTLGGLQNASARKTIKNRPTYDQYTPVELDDEAKVKMKSPESIDSYLEKQTDRNTKINSILNKITSFSTDDKLGDFNPMPYPTNITKRNSDQILSADEAVDNGLNPLMPKTGKPSLSAPPSTEQKYFRASEPDTSSRYSDYRSAYKKEGMSTKEPYYAKMGITKDGGGDKMMDRLNYITQMLESLQMEKTNHMTEEFVLYSLLGVFMIYIVDGFSRGGKYVR